MARIAIMALEGLEEDAAVGTDIPVEALPDEAESAITDMGEISDNISDGQDGIDEASATVDTLGDMADGLEATLPEGGVAPEAAEVISTAVEHMCSRIGIRKGNTRFALEGFKSKTTRVQATRVAMEGIKEWAQKIWKAISDFFKKAVQWVKDFINKSFDAAKKLKKRAEALKKAAEENQKTKDGKKAGKKENDAEVESGWFDMSWGKWLTHDGAYLSDAAAIIAKQATLKGEIKVMGQADGVVSDAEKCVDDAAKGVSRPQSGGVSAAGCDVVIKEMAEKFTTAFNTLHTGTDQKNSGHEEAAEDSILYAVPLPLGNWSRYVQTPDDNHNGEVSGASDDAVEKSIKGLGLYKVYFKENEKANEEQSGKVSIKPMDIGQIKTACDCTIGDMSAFSAYFNKLNAINKKQESIAAKTAKTINAVPNTAAAGVAPNGKTEETAASETEGRARWLKVAQAACKVALQMSTHGMAGERTYCIHAHKGVIDYAAKSLSLYR